jgi:hypothetical protein
MTKVYELLLKENVKKKNQGRIGGGKREKRPRTSVRSEVREVKNQEI